MLEQLGVRPEYTLVVILVALTVTYGVRMALSGKRGRPQGPL